MEHSGAYTPEQYQLAVRNLKFDGYESMPVAEFNRKIHTALTEAAGVQRKPGKSF